MLVGIPMAASAISTVITTTPLFATQTLILNSFAYVIAITMSVGLLYVWLFLTPMVGMLGPKAAHSDAGVGGDAPLWKRVMHTLYMSKAIRFIVVCALLYLFLVRCACPTRAAGVWWRRQACIAAATCRVAGNVAWRVQRFMPGTTEEFQNNGIAAELGEMLAYLLAAAAVVVVTRITIRIVQTNRQLHEKRVLDAERAAEDAEHASAGRAAVHRAPDQTFALPAAPRGQGGRPGFAAAARRSMRMSRRHARGSVGSGEARGGGVGGAGAPVVTGFGRGPSTSQGPGSTPPPEYPPRQGSVGYAPSQ